MVLLAISIIIGLIATTLFILSFFQSNESVFVFGYVIPLWFQALIIATALFISFLLLRMKFILLLLGGIWIYGWYWIVTNTLGYIGIDFSWYIDALLSIFFIILNTLTIGSHKTATSQPSQIINKIAPGNSLEDDVAKEVEIEERIKERTKNILEHVRDTDLLYLDETWLENKYLQLFDGFDIISKTTVESDVKAKVSLLETNSKTTREYARIETGLIVKYEQVLTKLVATNKVHVGIELPLVVPTNPQKITTMLQDLHEFLSFEKPKSQKKRKALLEVGVALRRLYNVKQSQYIIIADSFTITEGDENYTLTYTHPVARYEDIPIVIMGDLPKSLILVNHKSLFARRVGSRLKLTVLGLVVDNTVMKSKEQPEIILSIKAVQI